jgi:hypothetical protein
MICDCKLAWIWGLRNETKNQKLREGLEELTCFLEARYEPKFDSNEDFSRALEIVRNTGESLEISNDTSSISFSFFFPLFVYFFYFFFVLVISRNYKIVRI